MISFNSQTCLAPDRNIKNCWNLCSSFRMKMKNSSVNVYKHRVTSECVCCSAGCNRCKWPVFTGLSGPQRWSLLSLVDGKPRFYELPGHPQYVSFSISHVRLYFSSIPDEPTGKVSNLLLIVNVLVLPKFPAGLSCGESNQGLALTTYPRLEPRLKKEYLYSCTPSEPVWPVLDWTFELTSVFCICLSSRRGFVMPAFATSLHVPTLHRALKI